MPINNPNLVAHYFIFVMESGTRLKEIHLIFLLKKRWSHFAVNNFICSSCSSQFKFCNITLCDKMKVLY